MSMTERGNGEADVLVVGAGGGGLCAAVEAAEIGAKVIVIEKRKIIGGNTIIAGGRMNVAETKQQETRGIEDSTNLHYEQTLAAGDYVADPKLVNILTSNAKNALAYLEKHGMKFRDDDVSAGTGGIWPRGIIGVEPKGTGYIKTLKQAADKLGVGFFLQTKMTEIIREKFLSGKVIGIRVTGEDGQELVLKSKSVIIATGGFAGDVDFRIKYDHRWTKEFPSSNYSSITAEGLMILADVGGDLIGMDYIQSIPGPYDLIRKIPTTKVNGVISDQIWINEKGERIVKSDARRDKLRDACYEQKNHMGFQLCDERARQAAKDKYPYRFISDKEIETSVKNFRLYRGDNILELSENAGINPEGLENTIRKYNNIIDLGFDDELGQNPTFLKFKIEKPPFYVWRVTPRLHHSMGGVRINDKTQVLDRWDKVIPALYAVGEVTGGIHGANRMGGNALLEIIVFGMIAGENAAKEALKKEE